MADTGGPRHRRSSTVRSPTVVLCCSDCGSRSIPYWLAPRLARAGACSAHGHFSRQTLPPRSSPARMPTSAAGPACSRAEDPGCPFQVFGDVTIQRQNEGSMACSSRNPQTCLAAGNDYRLVGLPRLDDPNADGKVTADAWLGIFWSRNGGQAWRSTLLPGWKTDDPAVKDTTPEGAPAVNPIAGFQAAADPTLRAGTHGLFYLSGIAFNRAEEANGTSSALPPAGKGSRGCSSPRCSSTTTIRRIPTSRRAICARRSSTRERAGAFSTSRGSSPTFPRGLATCTIPAGPNGVPAAADHPDRHGLHRLRDVPRQRQQSAQRRLGEELQ